MNTEIAKKFKRLETEQMLKAIKNARQLISKKENWTKHRLASDHERFDSVSPFDEGAICFCAMGAISKSLNTPYTLIGSKVREWFKPHVGKFETIERFNDSFLTKHQDVLELFDKVIADLEKELENQ